MLRSLSIVAILTVSSALGGVIDPAYSGSYTYNSLGTLPIGVPGPLGGLTVKAGDPNTLLIGGAANGVAGAVYSVGVTRDGGGHINGFTGTSSLFSTAPNIDGGLAYAPNGTLFFTGYPINSIGQILPGSSTPDLTSAAPVTGSVGSLGFVPLGYNGAGKLVVAGYSSGQVCTTTLTPNGDGTYAYSACVDSVSLTGGLEGIVWVPLGSALFTSQSVLISEYGLGSVAAYEIDANGLPIPGTRTTFVSGLSGAEGAAIDPYTGDFLFSTFGGGNEVVVVQGFAAPPPATTPEPASAMLISAGLAGLVYARRRRKA